MVAATAPSSLDGWRAAFSEGDKTWGDLAAQGVQPIDIYASMLIQLHNAGYAATALAELQPTLYFDVSGYMDVPFTVLWTKTDRRTGAVQRATCWYLEPGAPPYCVDGDEVTNYGPLGTDLTDSWRALVELLVGLEAGWSEMAYSRSTGNFTSDCPARSCREIRREQVSLGNLLSLGSNAAQATMVGALVTGGAGAGSGMAFATAIQGVTALGSTAGSLEVGAGFAALLAGSAGAGLVIGMGIGAVIARATYISSGTVLGVPIGGGAHRCGNCGEVGGPYEGWTVDASGLNCGDPRCGGGGQAGGGEEEGGGCGAFWDPTRPSANGGTGVADPEPSASPTEPPENEHSNGGGPTIETGEEGPGECEVLLLVSGPICAVCSDLDPELYETEDAPECDDPEGDCEPQCLLCNEAGHPDLSTVTICFGSN